MLRGKYISYLLTSIAFLLSFLTACTYREKVAPIVLPERSSNVVVIGDGLKISARAFVEKDVAESAFGFNARGAGLLPVQVTFQNDGSRAARVVPEQTFLIDEKGDAWPVLSLDQTYKRASRYVEVGETLAGTAKPAVLMGVAGAIAGLAVGIVTGENIGESLGKGAAIGAAAGAIAGGGKAYSEMGGRVKSDIAVKSLRNSEIIPRQIAHGVIFFPGMDGEATTAKEMQLTITLGEESEVARISL